jgi:hypothetical protein
MEASEYKLKKIPFVTLPFFFGFECYKRDSLFPIMDMGILPYNNVCQIQQQTAEYSKFIASAIQFPISIIG